MTANDLMRRALVSVGVLGETQTMAPQMAADAFVTLNQFLSSLGGAEGFVTMQYTNPTDDIGLDDGYELMIQTNIAVLLAADYGLQASPTIQRVALSTKRSLKRRTTVPPKLRLDRGIRQWHHGGAYNIVANDYSGFQPPVYGPPDGELSVDGDVVTIDP